MQTQRLASLLNPSEVEHLLDSYVNDSGTLPGCAHKRDGWQGLSQDLRHFAGQAVADGYVCAVWTDGERNWFFAGSLAFERAREVGRPVLEVHRLDEASRARHSVLTTRLPDGRWCNIDQ